MLMPGPAALGIAICAVLGACQTSQRSNPVQEPRASAAVAIADVKARPNRFTRYPQADTTYLSFDRAHGFQVSYLGSGGKSWLWYPGNQVGVAGEWRRDTVQGIQAICFRHPSRSYNPVTKRAGDGFTCQDLSLSQKSTVAQLRGDPFGLSAGAIPYRRSRCQAPPEFTFDRNRFAC